MADTRFSLRNELVPAQGQDSYFELNPAVVSANDRECFALSAVYIGPEAEVRNRPVAIKVICDSSRSVLQAISQQCEPIDERQSLTVALFSVTRAFLETLARASQVEVELQPGTGSLTRHLAPDNRSNVESFLADIDARITSAAAAVPAGAVA
jgi:hypothetical protein